MKRTPLARTSPKQRARLAAYAKVRKAWLAEHPWCEVCLAVWQVTREAVEVHHQRGRVSTLLTDTRFFLSVCGNHHGEIHAHPKWARRHHFTASAREWGVPVPL